MSVDDRLAQWWASPPYSGTFVETLTIEHPFLSETIRLANGVAAPLKAFDENGVEQTYNPYGLSVEYSSVKDGTQQDFKFSIDGIDGEIYKQVKKLDVAYFETAPLLSLRLYVNPDFLDKPLRTPPPIFEVRTASITRQLVAFDCNPPSFPNRKSGYIFNINEFPGLSI